MLPCSDHGLYFTVCFFLHIFFIWIQEICIFARDFDRGMKPLANLPGTIPRITPRIWTYKDLGTTYHNPGVCPSQIDTTPVFKLGAKDKIQKQKKPRAKAKESPSEMEKGEESLLDLTRLCKSLLLT
jgi:hypothetical protein